MQVEFTLKRFSVRKLVQTFPLSERQGAGEREEEDKEGDENSSCDFGQAFAAYV